MSFNSIYLIDDEPELLKIFSHVANAFSSSVLTFDSACQFFENITAYDDSSIILLDLNMPDMDGIEVMRKLSVRENPPPLILISGTGSEILFSAKSLGMALGLKIIDVLTKPVRLQNIKELLEQNIPEPFNNEKKDQYDFCLTEQDLDNAIDDNQLVLYYQPQLEINTGTLVGVEALVRWQHPSHGLIFPDIIIPLAESGDLLNKLTSWVIDKASNQARKWCEQGFSLVVSVNVSASDINDLELPEKIINTFAKNKINSSKIALEITEQALLCESKISLDILTRARLKGIKLIIDDFGVGYSSLALLHQVPFTELKIDMSFIANMIKDESALSIVKACIKLGHDMGMTTIAEGVETKEQLNKLNDLNCDVVQGFFISKAVPASEIIEFMDSKCNMTNYCST